MSKNLFHANCPVKSRSGLGPSQWDVATVILTPVPTCGSICYKSSVSSRNRGQSLKEEGGGPPREQRRRQKCIYVSKIKQVGSRETPRGWGEGGKPAAHCQSGTLAALPGSLPIKAERSIWVRHTFTHSLEPGHLWTWTRGSLRLEVWRAATARNSKTEAARLTCRSELCASTRYSRFCGWKAIQWTGEKMGFWWD